MNVFRRFDSDIYSLYTDDNVNVVKESTIFKDAFFCSFTGAMLLKDMY